MKKTVIVLQLEKRLTIFFRSLFKRIYYSGKSLLGIVNNTHDMSKIETDKLELNPTEYDTASLINDAVQLNIPLIGSKPIDFILAVSEKLPSRLYGDELRLKQILNNLLSNAINYTKKGRVKLSVSHATEAECVELCFTVVDTGKGMKPKNLERLFSASLRSDSDDNRTPEGTGSGLNITKKFVSMMDGTIKVKSEYGKGSIFTVTVKQKAIKYDAIGPELADQLRSFTFKGRRLAAKLQISGDPMPSESVLDPKLLQIFCCDARKAVVTLRETLASGDIKLFTITAHAMKSALANIREGEISKLALALESAGKSRDMEFVSANTESFIEALEALVKKLTPVDAGSKNNADVTEDTAYLTEQLIIMRTACENYDNATAYAALDLLEEKPWKRSTAAALEEIRNTLFLHSDFEEADKLILTLLNSQQV